MQITEKSFQAHPRVMDYDEDNYDYRTFWQGRDYEQWAETQVLRYLFERVGQVKWLVDLGGGFGRNAMHYSQHADHAVLVDYSMGNLERAASSPLAQQVESGHMFLVRADLYRLPFVDGAFEVGLMVRVLHHLAEVDNALTEIGRIVGKQWILDVPIKNHALARIRGLLHGEVRQLSNWEPKMLGTVDMPFMNFHLAAVRQTLATQGWDNTVVASVNNFRRWDQVLPAPATTPLRPLVYGLEKMAQTVGKGWWGPSQFVWAEQRQPVTPKMNEAQAAAPTDLPMSWALLAPRMVCPVCRTDLQWSNDAAKCPTCLRVYRRTGAIWDFVPE